LTQALEKETDAGARSILVEGLASATGRLEPAEAARVSAAAARVLAQALEKETNAGSRFQLAQGLASLAGRLAPDEAARVCAPAAHVLTEALGKETDAGNRSVLTAGLAAVAERLEPAEALRVLTQVVEKKDWDGSWRLAQALASLAGRLPRDESARVCAQAARVLTEALGKETDAGARYALVQALASVAGRLEPAEAARLLMEALDKETSPGARASLGQGLALVADRLEPAEAGRLCARAARVLTQALEKEKDSGTRASLIDALAAVIGRPGPDDAARVGEEVVLPLIHRLKPEPRTNPFGHLQEQAAELISVASLLQHMDGAGVEPLARALARQIVSATDASGTDWGQFNNRNPLVLVLTDATGPHVQRRAAAGAAVVGMGSGGPLAALPLLPAAREPLPCRLSTQDLVDLLKMPTCVRDVRRVILDQLGDRYGRRFETHWDFVRYAQEQNLNLDFTTPPQRPDR
jgi:hypothetical protein